MRRFLVLGLAVLLALPVLLAGCGDETENTQTFETPEGEVTVRKNAPPGESELKARVYPGADYIEGTANSSSVSGERGDITYASASFMTDDAYDAVSDFYRGELGEPYITSEEDEGAQAVWVRNNEDQTVTSVTVRENSPEQGKVTIDISTVGGTGIPSIPGP